MNRPIPEPISLMEYQRRHDDDVYFDETVECPECDGSGDGECFHCGGHIECEECDGEGVVHKYTVPSTYKARVKADQEAWNLWCESMAPVA